MEQFTDSLSGAPRGLQRAQNEATFVFIVPEDSNKFPSTQPNQRRSQRVLLQVPLVVEGRNEEGTPFREETKTLVVNAHGCLLLLATTVSSGQSILVMHKGTRQKQQCRVVWQGKAQEGKIQTGVEFTEPSPSFWQVAFPPEDWKAVPV